MEIIFKREYIALINFADYMIHLITELNDKVVTTSETNVLGSASK
jgi:hypothetical protein